MRRQWRIGLATWCGLLMGVLGGEAGSFAQPPSGNNSNWEIKVTFTGSATSYFMRQNMNVTPMPATCNIQSHAKLTSMALETPAPGLDLATMSNNGMGQPILSSNGGYRAYIGMSPQLGMPSSSANRSASTSSGQMIVTFTYKAKNANDLPPPKLIIYYRRQVTASATATTQMSGQTATATSMVSLGGRSQSAQAYAIHAGGNTNSGLLVDADPDFIPETLTVPTNGVTTKTFSFSCSGIQDVNAASGGGNAVGTSATAAYLDICVAGYDYAKFGGTLASAAGSSRPGAQDPSYTRWLPLSFSPTINPQPFRTQAGALPAPWGNVHCYYSMTIRQEPNPPNYDLDGMLLGFIPSVDANGTMANPQPPYKTVPLSPFIPQYAILDATGDRLVYNASWQPHLNIRSSLAQGGGVFTLSNAGPPGAIRERGNYTYTFQTIQSSPLIARLTKIEEDLGNGQVNRQTLTWGASPHLTVTDNTSGRQIFFYTGANGYFQSVEAPFYGSTLPYTRTNLTYDGGGHLTAWQVYDAPTNTLLQSATWTYGGPNGDAVLSESQLGRTTGFVYTADNFLRDALGLGAPRLTSKTLGTAGDTTSSDDGGSVAGTYTYVYGPMQQGYNRFGIESRTNTITDPRNNSWQTQYGYNWETGALSSFVYLGPTFTGAPSANKTVVDYSPDYLQPSSVSVTDALNKLWQLQVDGVGNPTQFTTPLSAISTWSWSLDGKRLVSATDPTNLTWQFRYGENSHPASRLTSVLDPGNVVRMQAAYNVFGQPISTTIPAAVSASGLDEVTQYAYHATTGDLTALTDPLGNQVTVDAYSALGDPLSLTTYPAVNQPLTTQMQFSAAQQVAQVTQPNGVLVLPTYTNGRITRVEARPPGNPTPFLRLDLFFDSRGRPYQADDLIGNVLKFRYDKADHLTRILDGEGRTTRFAYGANSELTQVTWPLNQSGSLRYDTLGRLREVTDERGVVSQHTYDDDSRLTGIVFPATPAQNVAYQYDPASRLNSVTDSTGSRTYTYDAVRKRLTSVVTTINALPPANRTFTVSYAYYPDGKLASVTTPAGTTSFLYDRAGRPVRVTDPQGNLTLYAYDGASRLVSQTTTTTQGTTFLTEYVWGVSGQAGDPSLAPAYLRTLRQRINGQLFWEYTLTSSYRGQALQQQGVGGAANQTSNEQYLYDARGRVASETTQFQIGTTSSHSATYGYDRANNVLPNGDSSAWAYNANNQLTNAPATPGLTGSGGLTYDAAGNLTSLNGNALTWDVFGRLASYGAATFTYDAAGRRVSKTAGGVTTYYLWSGSALVAELDATGQVVRSYVWGAGGPLSDRVGNVSRFYCYDLHGNTRALLDGTGAVLSRGAWTAWGQPVGAWQINTPFGYKGAAGQYQDSETGLVYCRLRYYAPSLGRFLSRDPIGFEGGTNLYAYCMGDPVNEADPNGTCWAGGAVVGAVWAIGEGIYRGDSAEEIAYAAMRGAVMGALGGAVAGKLLSMLPKAMNCLAKSSIVGALSGGVADLAGQAMDMASGHQAKYNPWQTAMAMGTGGALGYLGARIAQIKCFPAGTPVQVMEETPSTATKKRSNARIVTKPIEQVKQGDTVVSRDERTGKTSYQKVSQTFVRQTDALLTIDLAATPNGATVESLQATREHPFYVRGKGFVPAGGLAVGNAIVTRAGPDLYVRAIRWQRRAEGWTVYNFEVQDTHSYFVGKTSGGVWVHNTCNFNQKNLQHEFSKHAPDFGVTGNWNKVNAAVFQQAIENHIANAPQKIPGMFRGTTPVTHYFDPASGLWVAVDANNNFIAGWKLSPAQIMYLLTNGNVQ